MQFLRGNKAIRDHQKDGKSLDLFVKTGKGFVRYIGEMEPVKYDPVENVPDRFRRTRTAIVISPTFGPPSSVFGRTSHTLVMRKPMSFRRLVQDACEPHGRSEAIAHRNQYGSCDD